MTNLIPTSNISIYNDNFRIMLKYRVLILSNELITSVSESWSGDIKEFKPHSQATSYSKNSYEYGKFLTGKISVN